MNSSMTRKEIEEHLIVKSWQDTAFKKELINDPKTVLKREGISLPDSINLCVMEEDLNTSYLIIPVQPSNPTGTDQLSEAELESIAGGYLDGGGCVNVKLK